MSVVASSENVENAYDDNGAEAFRLVWHFRDRNSAHNWMGSEQRPFGECSRRQRQRSHTHHMASLFAECVCVCDVSDVCVFVKAVCDQTVFNIDIETLTIITKNFRIAFYLMPLRRISIDFGVLIEETNAAHQFFSGKCQKLVVVACRWVLRS